MFNCDLCKIPTGPYVSPILVPTGYREVVYRNVVTRVDEETGKISKEEVHSRGKEIVAERKLCPACSGVVAHIQKDPDFHLAVSMGRVLHAQAASSKDKDITSHVVKRIVDAFGSMDPRSLSAALSDSVAVSYRPSLAFLVVGSMMDRTTMNNKGSERHVQAAAEHLAGYQSRGGKL